MHLVESSIEVNAPVSVCYEILSHCENYPKFMEKVISVTQKQDKVWHWMVRGPVGKITEWDSHISTMIPDTMISWYADPDAEFGNSGAINFIHVGHDHCRIDVRMTYSLPGGPFGEFITDVFGYLEPYIQECLNHFKAFVESTTPPQFSRSQSIITSP